VNDYFYACTAFTPKRAGDLPRKLFAKFAHNRKHRRSMKVKPYAPTPKATMSDEEYAGVDEHLRIAMQSSHERPRHLNE